MATIIRTRSGERVMTKALQVEMIKKALEKAGTANDLVDVEALVDETLHFYENLRAISQLVGKDLHASAEQDSAARSEAMMAEYEGEKIREIRENIKGRNIPNRDAEIEVLHNLIQWKKVLPLPSVALISGRRGAGKSCLMYWLLSYLPKEYGISAHVIGIPKEKYNLLPPEIKPLEMGDLDNLPENAMIAVDEAGILFYARQWKEDLHSLMDKLLSISRQKNQIVLLATHASRKLDVGILMDCDALLFKEPSILHARLDRREIRQLTEEAMTEFRKRSEKDRKKFTYVYSHTIQGTLLENPPPSFWSEDLSKAFAGIDITTSASGKKTSLEEAVAASMQRQELLKKLLVK